MQFLLIVVWFSFLCAFVASIAVSVNAFQRWGRERGLPGILCPLGVAMTFDLFVHQLTAFAVARTSGSALNLQAQLTALGFALLGIALAITGWMKTHPREFPTGCCQKCGYDLKELARCPECGRERPAREGDGADESGSG